MNTPLANSHQIEPELLRATPRAVRRKKNGLLELGCLGLFLVPFVAVGIGSFFTAMLALLVVLFGQNVPATISGHYTSENDEDGTSYHLDYTYSINGATHETTQSVSSGQYDAWRDGDTLMARVLPQFPSRGAQLQFPNRSRWGTARFWWGFALGWNAVALFCVWKSFAEPMMQRNLVALGSPTVGLIVDKTKDSSGDSDSYIVHFEYSIAVPARSSPPQNSLSVWSAPTVAPEVLKNKMTVSRANWEVAKTGEEVSVLYDPQHPGRSLIYKYSDYEAVA